MLGYAKPLFWSAAIFAFVMAILPHPPSLPGDPGDKIQHVIAFVTLGALSAVTFEKASQLRLIAALAAFGAAIEIIQGIPSLHRDSEIADVIADVLAASAAVWMTRKLLNARRR